MTDWLGNAVGRRMVAYLNVETGGEAAAASCPKTLAAALQVGDVLLVAGRTRIASVIKHITCSTWSHAALYVGDLLDVAEPDGERHVIVEMEIGVGCISAPLSKYVGEHTRICRPVDLDYLERERVARYCILRLGYDYDVKNVFDLMRFLLPMPVPARFRRRMLALGSGLPTRAICSTLIARAFEQVRYPILPHTECVMEDDARREILHIRHHSLYCPRDFDISPYFEIVKPTILRGFDYRAVEWASAAE